MDQPSHARPTVRSARGPRYPESDGKPLGETGVHINVMFAALDMLRRHFARQPRVAILSNMFVYFVEGEPKKVVCPDLFVTLNVPSTTIRRTFKTWLEGKVPDLVIEVTSKKTKKEDLHTKFELYRDVLKVCEYFLFDPLEEYLEPSLQGFRRVQDRYESIAHDGIGLVSEVLGLRLEREGMDLRFFDPAAGRYIPTTEELARALSHEAEARARAEEENERLRRAEAEARARAEGEIERLRRENEALLRRLLEERT